MTAFGESVVIVGAGPVGLTCALKLVEAGVPVCLLEREPGLPQDMRASTFHPATLDVLAESGISELLLKQGTTVSRWQFWNQSTDERIVFDLDVIADATKFPFRLQCEQFRLTAAVVHHLRDHPLFTLIRGANVTRVEPHGDHVWLEYEQHGERINGQCPWLIAADGGKSTVRKSLGLAFKGSVFPRTSITLVLDYPFQHDVPGLLGVNYVWTQTGHFSLMQIRDLWRFSYAPDDEDNPQACINAEGAQARLQAVFPRQRPYRILQLNHYTLQQRCLDSFRHGRVLFCGDAAHLNSPAGGMGMNSGIHDAVCLVEHLLPVLQGHHSAAEDTGLDRYDRRRRGIALDQVQRLSAKNYRRHRETNPDRRLAVWGELKSISEDREKMRDYLLASSMIESRRIEAQIE